MARQAISTGTAANDGTGDNLRDGGVKINANFSELYTDIGGDATDDFMGDIEADPKVDEFAFEEAEDEDDDVEESMIREYVEKVATAKMGDNGANAKSIVAGKNDMGGTTANIVKGADGGKGGTQGGLANPSTKEDNAGNVNVPGAKSATKLKSVPKGHGAEKKGTGDNGANSKSLIGSRK